MAGYGRGLICLAIRHPSGSMRSNFHSWSPTVARDSRRRFASALRRGKDDYRNFGCGSGPTVLAAINPAAKAAGPGPSWSHLSAARESAGVLVRAGQTEAAVDLARLAGLHPAGVICEIMNRDGPMARVPQLRVLRARHDILLVAITDFIDYRLRTESVVKAGASTRLLTEYGEFRLHAFENQIDKQTHVALVRGDVGNGQEVLVRVHSQCLTGDVLRSVVATAAPNSIKPCVGSRLKVAEYCFTSIRKDEGSASPTRFGRTLFRTKG